MRRVDSLEKILTLGGIGGRRRRGRQRMRWLWVWVDSDSWWWIGRPGVLRFMGSQRVGHDWATELNWKGSGHAGYHCSNIWREDCLWRTMIVNYVNASSPFFLYNRTIFFKEAVWTIKYSLAARSGHSSDPWDIRLFLTSKFAFCFLTSAFAFCIKGNSYRWFQFSPVPYFYSPFDLALSA